MIEFIDEEQAEKDYIEWSRKIRADAKKNCASIWECSYSTFSYYSRKKEE